MTQRGNRRENVFFTRDDCWAYLKLLWKYAQQEELLIHAYCLMPNHVHLVATPLKEESLAKALQPLHLVYAQRINQNRNLVGRLWQNRFFSCPLDKAHTIAAVRYVECNPVRAGLAARPEQYPWSSAYDHCAPRYNPLLTHVEELPAPGLHWCAWLNTSDTTAGDETLRTHTATGRPLGTEAFVHRVEQFLNRPLQARPRGRPKTQK